MNLVRTVWQKLLQDPLLKGVLRNTSYLFSSTAIGMALVFVQSILAARLLGVSGFGILGTITVFASTVNRLFSFQMSEMVVKFLGEYLPSGRHQQAGALVKFAGLMEIITSLLAFGVLALLAPWASVNLTKNAAYTPMFLVYGLSILAALAAETSMGVLRSTDKFRSQAAINLIQSVVTAVMIVIAFLTHSGIWLVLIAYLTGKIILNFTPVILAWRELNRVLGRGWWKTPITVLPSKKSLFSFAFSTNFSSTIQMLARDSEVLWISWLLSPLQAGYYKAALAIINLITLPITPFINTTFPEISRSVAARSYDKLRRLLRQVTAISGGFTGLVGLGILILGPWLVLLYGPEYGPAYPALAALLVGYGFANIFFWNRPLLISFGLPGYALRVMFWTALAKVALTLLIVPRWGYVAQAALLSAYFLVSIGLVLWRGLSELRKAETAAAAEAAA